MLVLNEMVLVIVFERSETDLFERGCSVGFVPQPHPTKFRAWWVSCLNRTLHYLDEWFDIAEGFVELGDACGFNKVAIKAAVGGKSATGVIGVA